MNKTILITQPAHDYTTRYISAWANKVALYADEKNDTVISLKNSRANQTTFVSITKKINPSFIFLNGHGNESTVAGHDNKSVLSDSDNLNYLKNKIIYALSCRSAKKLGPYCVRNGIKTYIGYTEDYIFVIDRTKRTKPQADKSAALFLNASNNIPIALLKGKTAQEAYSDSQNAYKKQIRRLLSSESTSHQSSKIRFLLWDMKHLVCLGDQNARI